MQRRPSNAAVKAYPATRAPSPLLSLPAGLVDDVVSRAVQLGAGGALSLTLSLDKHRCNQLLTSRVVAALSARTRRFALVLKQSHALSSGHYTRLPPDVLNRLGSCAAAETCKLVSLDTSDADVVLPLDCMDLAQPLIDSIPRLTSLALHGYSIPCSSLAALLSHQRLSLQLQQLNLTGSTIAQPKRPESGAVTLANLFHGVRLQHLSLDVARRQCFLTNPPEVLRAFPRMRTLQLPGVTMYGQEQLDTLLAATQLTSVQLQDLSSSRADAPCSWQRLELTHWIDCSTAAYLPMHSLTQPLLLGGLSLEKDMEEVSMERHGRAKQLVVFFGAAGIGTRGGGGADAVLRACCKVVCRPRGTDQRRGRVVLVDEHRTSRVSSAVNGQQPCERQLKKRRTTRLADWKPPGQVQQRLVRQQWSQQRDQPVRGLMWCPVVPPASPHMPHAAARQPHSQQPQSLGPATAPPAQRSKRTKAEQGAELLSP
ncbi:hypothetical protein QJQ45_013593 [Haematococcus lacustris]|nr:hypothetical protein QJQ45_013593 [Haematococcus lacustris]